MEIVGGKSVAPGRLAGGTPGETHNVSSCGVLFSATAPMGIGEPIEYMITLPKAPGARIDVRLRCIGTVVRSTASQFAATMDRYEFVREQV